ncbi:MAG TPA: hypothetical protein VKA84_23025, partial [Gemmatimonadaceae bacterium]|nr:hypothetical protein [Gemmatimonadaceae bacterium]
YAPDAPEPSDELRARAYRVFQRVDAEARARGSAWRREVTALVATLGVGAAAAVGALRAEQAGSPGDLFARGVAVYQSRQYAEARRLFAESGALEFRAPDAWANFGTAGWVAGDTAAAAVGWQRALRMEPTADDVRDRLALLPSGHDGPIAAVPRLPAAAPALAALALWVAAWLLAAYAGARSLPELRPIIGAALFSSVVLGGTSLYLRDRLAGTDLVAFSDDGDLRVLPALSAERAQHATTGEVGRSLSRQGAWTRVRLDGDREGWVESDRLVEVMLGQ